MDLKKITPPAAAETPPAPPVIPTKPAGRVEESLPAKDSSTSLGMTRKRGWLKIVMVVFGVLLVLAVAIGIPAYLLAAPLQATLNSANTTIADVQNQDLVAAKEHLEETRANLKQVQDKYSLLTWLQGIPVVRNYYLDGRHGLVAGEAIINAGGALIEAITPYSDLLGFKTDSASPSAEMDQLAAAQSAEERIVILAQTLGTIAPQLETVKQHLNTAQQELEAIDPNRYPSSVAGKPVRAKIVQFQTALKSTATVLTDAQPLILLLPELLGQTEEKTYLLLFQNDAEIRPTGGFLTAYAYITVFKGKITPKDSYDMYDLDARFTKRVEAPEPIKKYLKENTWNLRNMNLSPDFKVSMDTFIQYYRQIPAVPQVDGIIALDTQVPVALLQVLGPIGVGGWGNFSAENDSRCDCPQVVYQLENIATRPTSYIREDRKAVLGPLMHSIMANAMGSPKSMWPQLMDVGLNAIKEKHLLFYFFDEKTQASAEAFGAAGRIRPYEGDYLHINNSNFGGAKSNLFTDESVEQEIELAAAGQVTKTVTITYNNPHPPSSCDPEKPGGDLCLNALLKQWVRLYVPHGSKLIEVVGSTEDSTTGEDLDKTVFGAFFTLRPQSSSKLVFKYELPGSYQQPFLLLIQKQPGQPDIKHTITFNGIAREVEVVGDLELTLP